jgi:HlyD family secretion protein
MASRNETLSTVLERGSAPRAEARVRPGVLPENGRSVRWFERKSLLATAAALLLACLGVLAYRALAAPAAPAYESATVQRGDLAKTISATGKLQALTTVQVGTQVSGTISELHADFNTKVTKGEVIARLDPSQLQAQLTQANASLASAQAAVQSGQTAVVSADAGVESAQANVERLDSVVQDAQRNYNRTEELVNERVSARRDLEVAQATLAQAVAQKQQGVAQLNQAKAQAQSARSQLAQSRAQADQAQASVQLASVNLERTIIRAPIDGVVVERNVDVGQTVAASLQAPTIFVIANDLTRMQVLADIDEADVGQLAENNRVTFTVDAYPADTFNGRISQIRLAPVAVQNVVTYTAVIEVANPDLKLKPGMTATVTAVVAERKDALTVPNAALRFQPASAAAEQTGAPARRPGRSGGSTVWKIGNGSLTPVRVRLGMTDGISSEVLSGDLKQGDRIAVAAPGPNNAPDRTTGTSPFQMRRGAGAGGRRS